MFQIFKRSRYTLTRSASGRWKIVRKSDGRVMAAADTKAAAKRCRRELDSIYGGYRG